MGILKQKHVDPFPGEEDMDHRIRRILREQLEPIRQDVAAIRQAIESDAAGGSRRSGT
jgi:hypothetical protein